MPSPAGHEHQSVHRRGDVDWTVHGAGAHRDLHLLAADPRLPGRYHHVLFHAKIFTAIAFDSGGVASGPMTATFLLPFAMGACDAIGGSIITDAFGVVAMVAMTPLITIQMLGLLYQYRLKKNGTSGEQTAPADDDIIEL